MNYPLFNKNIYMMFKNIYFITNEENKMKIISLYSVFIKNSMHYIKLSHYVIYSCEK